VILGMYLGFLVAFEISATLCFMPPFSGFMVFYSKRFTGHIRDNSC
jgi:hypothetical protein